MYTQRASDHLAAIRAAAGLVGLPLDNVEVATDELDGNQLVVRGVDDARQLLAAVIKLGYRLVKRPPVGVQVPRVRLLTFSRQNRPELSGWGDRLAGSLTVVMLLNEDESVGYQVRVPGDGSGMVLHGIFSDLPNAYKVAYELFQEQGVKWVIIPDLFAEEPLPSA